MRRSLALGAFALIVLPLASSFAHAETLPPPPGWKGGARPSAALERMLRDQLRLGLRLTPDVIARFGLDLDADLPDAASAPADALAPALEARRAATLALGPDVHPNDKSGDAPCSTCNGFAPLNQAETTIAASGSNLLAGWNDSRGFCPPNGAVQGYAWSTDMGATWSDGGDPPALASGGRYRGDPVHFVNRATGDFYLLGLYEGGFPGSGLAMLRGHFAGGTFVINDNRQIAVGGNDFIDKPWATVDPLSGNIYVSYTLFPAVDPASIQMIRSTDNGVTWDPPIHINPPSTDNLIQGSRPVVDADGTLYVAWYEYGYPVSHHRIRRSTDGGVSFDPVETITDFYENSYSGGPGFRRGFGITLPSIAVDNTAGPYRGRLYAAWDEAVNFYDASFPFSTFVSEVENNGNFGNATPFAVGDVVRGAMASTTDLDFYRFDVTQGQTIVFAADSVSAGTALNMWLTCSQDTLGIATYRFLAYDQLAFPQFAVTIPVTGTYYLRLTTASSTVGNYRLRTTFDTPSPGERASDHRDQFLAYSDDGVVWSTPVKLNSSAPHADAVFPEVTVDGLGRVHVFWHDWRDDAVCGALSYEYMVSSGDGGVTWGPNRRLSDEQSFWSFFACGSANQGDYQGITSEGANVYPIWADSRLGDVDPWTEKSVFAHDGACPAPISGDALADPVASFTLSNQGNSGSTFNWHVEDDNGWILSATPGVNGSMPIAAGGSQQVDVTFHISPTCSPAAVDPVRFITEDTRIPGRADTCLTTVTCTGDVTGLQPGAAALWLGPPSPSPSDHGFRLSVSLTRPGRVSLGVYDAKGARVRTLLEGVAGPGTRGVAWDGADEGGRRVAAGVYYVKLEAEGRRLTRTAVVVD